MAPRCFVFGLVAMTLCSCMVMRTQEKGYGTVRTVQDGTAFEAVMLPEGESGGMALSAMVVAAGAMNVHGPYRLQVTAYGRQGEHLTFEIRQVRIRSATGRTFGLSSRQMGGSPLFVPGEWQGEVKAVRTARGVIPWDPETQGRITVEVDVTIRTTSASRSGTLRMEFLPIDAVKVEAVNVAWEVKKSIWKEAREHPISAWD
jgi:hypothetical protein